MMKHKCNSYIKTTEFLLEIGYTPPGDIERLNEGKINIYDQLFERKKIELKR